MPCLSVTEDWAWIAAGGTQMVETRGPKLCFSGAGLWDVRRRMRCGAGDARTGFTAVNAVAVCMCVVVEFVGATVQGMLGFGMNLVAAPLLVLIDPQLGPVPLVLSGFVVAALVGARERGSVDRASVGWAIVGLLPGSALGMLIVESVARGRLQPVVGVVVLSGVLFLLAGRGAIRRTQGILIGVGALSGVMSIIAGLGGAAFGLVCHDLPGPVLRPTLSLYVLAGTLLSAGMLAGAGEITGGSLRLTAVLLPGVLGGVGLSRRLIPLADRWSTLRPAVLAVATVGALAAIAKGWL